MRRLVAFNNVTLDGYFAAKDGDFSWAHGHSDPEFNAFVQDNAKAGGTLVFGRVTYQMMASYWPTPIAAKNDPVVAERMNNLSKVVFSRTLESASWNNTRLVKGDAAAEIKKLKNEPGTDMAILGSGNLISQLTQAGLIDEFQFAVNPVILGAGRTMFEGIKDKLDMKLVKTRTFANGIVFLCYEPTT
jgi:dihydrofolate reductase